MDEDLVNLTWLMRQPNEFIPHESTPPASPKSSPADPQNSETPPQTTKKPSLPAVDYSRVPKKPKLSYAQLITEAMKAYGNGPVLLTDIYDWIKENYCFYRYAEPSWQAR